MSYYSGVPSFEAARLSHANTHHPMLEHFCGNNAPRLPLPGLFVSFFRPESGKRARAMQISPKIKSGRLTLLAN